MGFLGLLYRKRQEKNEARASGLNAAAMGEANAGGGHLLPVHGYRTSQGIEPKLTAPMDYQSVFRAQGLEIIEAHLGLPAISQDRGRMA